MPANSISKQGTGMQAATNKILTPRFGNFAPERSLGRTEDLIGFDHSTFPICILDEETLEFLAVNDAAVELYGYSREEFLQMTLQDVRPQESRDVLMSELESMREGTHGTWYSRIASHRRKNGSYITVQVTRSRIHFAGRPALLCSAENMSQRIQNAHQSALFLDGDGRERERSAELWAATLQLRFKIAQHTRLERRNAAFLKLGQSLSSATTAYDAAQIVSEVSLDLFGWDAYLLDLFSAGTNQTMPVLYYDTVNGTRVERELRQPSEKLTARALRIIEMKGQLLTKDSHTIEPSPSAFFGDLTQNSASVVAVPIESRGQAIGTLSVQSYRSYAYSEDDLETLRALADHCAGALERVSAEESLRKFEERNTTLLTTSNLRLQFEINRRYRLEKRNEAFSKLGRLLSAVSTVRDAAKTIAAVADELLGWDSCNFQLYDTAKRCVTRILNIDTINGKRSEIPLRNDATLSPMLMKVLEQGPQLILRKEPLGFTDGTHPFGDIDRPSASLMFVPFRQRDAVKGFLSIHSYSLNAYTPDDLNTLLVLADHGVGAIERIWMEGALLQSEAQKNAMLSAANAKLQREIAERRRLEQELLETADNERRRIGQDLHDDVGQQLTGINLLSQGLSMRLAKKKLRPEAAEAARIRRLTVNTLQRARALAHGLASFHFNDNDLVASLENLAHRTKSYLKISCSVAVTGKAEPLETEVVRQLHSITQEAVTNAVKHGRAKTVDIQITFTHAKMVLTVKNDGRRFTAHTKATPGMGLRIMQYRASVIGATLQLRSNGISGTVLTCSLPLKKARKPRDAK